MVLALVTWLVADAASEGKKVVLAMLVVGLIFIGVIALGETSAALGRRRSARKPRGY